MKPFLTILSSLVIFTLLFVGFWLGYIFFGVSGNPQPVDIQVEQGEPFATVVHRLHAQRVITNEKFFSLWARISGSDKKIQSGLYRFDPAVSPREVLNRMVLGKGLFYSVTIPEGLTIKEIADLLANLQLVDRAKFLAQAADPELLATLGLQGKGIEGYLFPSTYRFTPLMSERDILLIMVGQFRKVSEPLWDQYGATATLTLHEIVTLASMIEKETGVEAERPLVSAVFYNRLRLHMPLQSDPTVIYGLKNYNGDLTRRDLQDTSPYNTYRIPGLPPGPICNPGLSSLKAALKPAPVSYLYFVSKNDGTHVFSNNLAAHNKAVKQYQLGHEDSRSSDKHNEPLRQR